MQIEVWTDPSEVTPTTAKVASFVRRALGLRCGMRYDWETEWWPIDAREVAETLAGYYYNYGMHSCHEQMREGKDLPSGLAFDRMRRNSDRCDSGGVRGRRRCPNSQRL